jgi:hypothetical protein
MVWDADIAAAILNAIKTDIYGKLQSQFPVAQTLKSLRI